MADGQTRAPAHPIRELTSAFHVFSESSGRLEDAYRQLQDRLRQLDRELVDTNRALNLKVAELHSLTGYLNDILSGMHNGVVAVDAGGRVTAINRAAQASFGVDAADVLGLPHERIYGNADGSRPPLSETLQSGVARADVEREVAGSDGRRLRLSSRVAPIGDTEGRRVGAVEIFRDLTELRQLQERLDRADKLAALGQMAAQVAHEIRNPLNGIEGFAALLFRDLDPGDKRRQFAQNVITGARTLNKIVTNMLLFCQARTVQLRPTSARAVVEEALLFVEEERRHLGHEPLEVTRSYDADADLLLADPDQLRQALMNLLLNAAQAMGERGRLHLAVHPAVDGSHRARLIIRDHGPGIPPELRHKVLDPFFTTKSTGTGLGLAIVLKLVDLQSGELELDSDSGRGTTAVITLPLAPHDARDSAPPRNPTWPSSECSLLTTTR